MNPEYENDPAAFAPGKPVAVGQEFGFVSRYQPTLLPGMIAVWFGPFDERPKDTPRIVPLADVRPVYHTRHTAGRLPGFLVDDEFPSMNPPVRPLSPHRRR